MSDEGFGKRRYSVEEMDRMRSAIHGIHPMPMSGHVSNTIEEQTVKMTEDYLRSYMLNGTAPEDLERKAEEIRAARYARMRERGDDFINCNEPL